MCGIAGIVSLNGSPVLKQEVGAMCDVLVHRGPDEDGFYIAPGVGMGMRRLKIIDLETGRQPVRNEDGTVWTVFNGEIYNYRELRSRLQSLGHTFYTATDTETIVHLYEEYGEDCVQFLRGMFALAVWDSRQKRLLLARDRLGIKPLYYAVANDRLCFASELKALLQLDIPRDLDWKAVGHLVGRLTTPSDRSIVRGIRKLPPACRLSAGRDTGRVSQEVYWDIRFNPFENRSEASYAEELAHLLDESVRLHMVSDVPVGAFLSGGVDSSAVVSSMAKASRQPIKTFSIGFQEERYNELPHARRVAEAFGTDHHEAVLEPNVLDIIDKLVWHLDEPFGDSSAIPTYMVSKLAAESVTVVLSGDGGDELFAGYDKYVVEGRERRYDRLPPFLRRLAGAVGDALPEPARGKRFLTHFGMSGAERCLDASTLFRTAQFRRLFTQDALDLVAPDESGRAELSRIYARTGNWLSALQYMDLKNYLPLDILTKVDRMSMAHSIETRVPLLDHKLVEFAAKIPPELQLRGEETKHIFKAAMSGVLGESVVNRPKRGFAVPLGTWFRGKLEGFARDILLSSQSRCRGIFNPHYVQDLLARHAAGRELDLHLWTLISFELWCRTFLDSAVGSGREKRDIYEVSVIGSTRVPGLPESPARSPSIREGREQAARRSEKRRASM